METYKAHETAVIDPGCTIGDGTHIWQFFPYYARGAQSVGIVISGRMS